MANNCNSFNDLERILKDLEKDGCTCDLMYGSSCNVHSKVKEGFLTIANIKKRMGVLNNVNHTL